ncbi:hypothetical protein DWB84_15420 [Saccharophagus sp. K07]|nr:hypothetical protein [Saccharophagus sp. K07]
MDFVYCMAFSPGYAIDGAVGPGTNSGAASSVLGGPTEAISKNPCAWHSAASARVGPSSLARSAPRYFFETASRDER